MLMVGFKGDTITADNPVVGYVRDLGVGAVILFDVDLTGDATLGSRNITSRERLTRLTADLRALAGERGLLIAADQEGGRVQRLKPRYGYEKLPTARALGEMVPDSVVYYGRLMAGQLREAGVNVNLAPELDLHRDDCPVIGGLDRAFSSDPARVVEIAETIVKAHRDSSVYCCLKHFPGHGSATADSHYGLTDVTATWTPVELEPFRRLVADSLAPMIMTAHIFNRQLDPDLPATLSRRVLTDLLRGELGYDGVIVTDDMYMQGIIDNYSIEEAIVLTINAGADLLCMGNNISTGFEPERPYRVVDMIVGAVRDGRIPEARVLEAAARVDRLLKGLQQADTGAVM